MRQKKGSDFLADHRPVRLMAIEKGRRVQVSIRAVPKEPLHRLASSGFPATFLFSRPFAVNRENYRGINRVPALMIGSVSLRKTEMNNT